jgi:hypothetical protein
MEESERYAGAEESKESQEYRYKRILGIDLVESRSNVVGTLEGFRVPFVDSSFRQEVQEVRHTEGSDSREEFRRNSANPEEFHRSYTVLQNPRLDSEESRKFDQIRHISIENGEGTSFLRNGEEFLDSRRNSASNDMQNDSKNVRPLT